MEPLDELRAKIADFPGYGDELERRRSDEYVRAYLGEALAAFAARTELEPGVRQRLDDLTLRLAFADQRAFSEHLRSGERQTGDGAVMRADAAAVELAGQAASLDADTAPHFLDAVAAVIDEREAALRAATLKMA